MKRLLLCSLLCAGLLSGGTKRILLVGDSWMTGMVLTKAGDRALAAHSLGEFETEGSVTETALGGSEARQWAANHKGKLDKIREVLARHPTIDIVHLCIGGNDVLGYALRVDLATQGPDQRVEKWLAIRRDVQTVVDFILALKPDLRVVINDYDYLDPDRIAKTYHADFHGVSARVLNDALMEAGRQKEEVALATPRCYYVRNWGLIERRLARQPTMPDGVHPTAEGFQALFDHAVEQYYAAWLKPAAGK